MLECRPVLVSNLRDVRVLLAYVVLTAGCQPEIGDDCALSTDCSQQGDRQCDTTQPGGYCTIFNCEPGGCPEEAICVAFSGAPPSAQQCEDTPAGLLKRRTYCLRSCQGNKDCRSGYECADLGRPGNSWGAVVVEPGAPAGRACVVPVEAVALQDAEFGVCEPREISSASSGVAGSPTRLGTAGSHQKGI